MSSASHSETGRRFSAFSIVFLMLLVSFSHIQFSNLSAQAPMFQTSEQIWDDLEQPWGQYGGSATRNGSMPAHDSSSGPMKGKCLIKL